MTVYLVLTHDDGIEVYLANRSAEKEVVNDNMYPKASRNHTEKFLQALNDGDCVVILEDDGDEANEHDAECSNE